MARLVDDELERLKQEVSLQDLVESYGVELKKKGKDLIGLCPFHPDKNPSLVVTPDKNLWHCLGACQEGGSVIDWVMKSEGVSFRHAVEILKEREGIGGSGGNGGNGGNGNGRNGKSVTMVVPPKPVKQSTVLKLDSPFENLVENQALLNRVSDFYHETLKEHTEGMDYLQQRSLKHPEMIDHFKLGLSQRTLCYRLPDKNRKAGAEIRGKLQELGILRESGHEHFSGSLVIPIFDETGNVVEMYGRKLRNDLRKGTAYHLYLPGPHRGVWNMAALAASKEIILCEALIDALTFWCYGFRNVTASYGINGFTKEHLEAFKRYGTEKVLIAYDRDEAGERAAVDLAKKLMAEGIDCYRIQFPLALDANEYAQQAQNPEKALDHIIQRAEWIGNGNGKKPIKTTILDAHVQEEAAKEEKEKTAAGTPLPAPPGCNIPAEETHDGVIISFNDRRWRIRGLAKNMSYEIMKVNIFVSNSTGDQFHVDTLELYSAKQRAGYIKQAAAELAADPEVIKKDLGKVLLKLEELQDQQIKQALKPKKKEIVLSEKEKKEAMELLTTPNLLQRILQDFRTCGVVGEETNKMVGYLAAVSRKLVKPLAIMIQSSSAAGKTWLMESVLSFVPSEERIKYSAMTGQALFYMGETDVKQKILAIVEEEGAERTRYALKLLQSEGELTIASTGKDPISGELTTRQYRVEGPVMIFSTTTDIDIDEELQNRCIILTVDESREQTRAIHQMQREQRTLKGLQMRTAKERLLKVHRNAQRLLRPLFILNPYANRLTFLDDKTRTRRDHEKYLCLIDSIALMHQYQRKLARHIVDGKPRQVLVVTLDDIEMANHLADEVLGRSLDELAPQTRRLLMLIEEMVDSECKRLKTPRSEFWFTRRRLREYCGWGNTQLKVHLKRLEDMEYLLVHHGYQNNRGLRSNSYEYELVYDGKGKDGSKFLMGLIDVNKLSTKVSTKSKAKKQGYDEKRSGEKEERAEQGRALVGVKSVGGRSESKPLVEKVRTGFSEKAEKTHI
jgi:DNA primase